MRLAKEARELAVVAMQKEPQDDLAQHLMGRQTALAPCPSMPCCTTACETYMVLEKNRLFYDIASGLFGLCLGVFLCIKGTLLTMPLYHQSKA